MSSHDSSPVRALDTRFSTPAPELDDHRRKPRRRASPTGARSPAHMSPIISAGQNLNLPGLELRQPTPQNSMSGQLDLSKVDETLQNRDNEFTSRDFEQAVSDHSDDDVNVTFDHGRHGSRMQAAGRRSSAFRDNRRSRRTVVNTGERSRDTSSSRSTSPANSVEAFAAPPRRPRANTAESFPSVTDLQHQIQRSRQFSFVSGVARNHPTLSHIQFPPTGTNTHRTNEPVIDDDILEVDEEPGKTYRIDFEELDEFIALSAQGLLPGHSGVSEPSTLVGNEPKAFHDLRQDDKFEVNNIALNSETFYEKPVVRRGSVTQLTSGERLLRQKATPKEVQRKRFNFFSSDIQKPKTGATLGDLLADGNTFRDLFDLGPEGGTWWLDVQNPTKVELEVIAKAFKIHRLTKEDIETQEAREKVELFSNYYFVCFRTFNPDKESEDFLDPLPVYVVVTSDGVLSFSYTPNPHASNVRRRITKLGDFVSLGPDYICYAMIDDIVDSFAPIIYEAETESENIEDQVFTAREEDFVLVLRQIAECRKRVLNMMRLLGGKADVIKGFAKRCNEQYSIAPRGDIGLYLGDIQDHVVTMMSNLNHIERLLSRSHGNYLAQLNVDHIMKGNHTNRALAKITVLASVIVPLNIITGLFGMNVHVPGQDDSDDHYAWFLGIVGVLLTFVICALLVAKRARYI